MLSSRFNSAILSVVAVALLCWFGLLGAAEARGAEPTFPAALRVGLVPPPGFVTSTAFQGFQHDTLQANILVGELPGYAYESIEKEIAAELEKNPGAATRMDIALKDGIRGFVLKGAQASPQGELLKWTLVATSNDVTAVVTALVPEAVKEAASQEAILAAFASLTIRPEVPVEEQLSVLPFSMSDLAGFRIIRVQPGSAAMLTDGPNNAIEAAEQPLLLIAIGAAPQAPPPAQRDGFARRLIGDTPGMKEIRVLRSEPLRIAGQQGHELLLEAKDAKTGIDLGAVQWIRFGSGTLMRIFGVARKDKWDATFARFRQVRDGIGPR